MNVRRMEHADAPALDALYQVCHPTWPAKPEGFWWAHPTLVLEVDDAGIIGSTSFAVSPAPAYELVHLLPHDRAEVGWGQGVYVAPDWRNQGFGQELADARHAALKQLGVGFFIGLTQPDNKAMIQIFERQQLTRGATAMGVYPDGRAGIMYTGGIV